jgi:hypothetical protein
VAVMMVMMPVVVMVMTMTMAGILAERAGLRLRHAEQTGYGHQ